MKIAVRALAESVGRTGDLMPSHFSLIRGVDGIRTHQRIQRNRGGDYQAEVPLERIWQGKEMAFTLRGRVDGVTVCARGDEIEEIKTSSLPEGVLPVDSGVHWLQACLYAAMWLNKYPAEQVAVSVRYAPPTSGEGWTRREVLAAEEIERTFQDACRQFEAEQIRIRDWRRIRNDSLQNLAFPFEQPRPGQQEFMEAVRDTLQTGGRLYAEAPTGIGKTMAALVPTLRDLDTRFFYLTARNAGKRLAEEAIEVLRGKGARVRCLTLVARDRVCNEIDTPCRPQECPLALGFFDRLPAALQELRESDDWTEARWTAVAKNHQLCPYAFALRAAREADGLIGDVNYGFDPKASLRWAFESEDDAPVLLVDEAHQLPARARGMFSADIPLPRLRVLKRELQVTFPELSKAIDRFSKSLREAGREAHEVPRFQARVSEEIPGSVMGPGSRVMHELEPAMADAERAAPHRPALREVLDLVGGFLWTAEEAGPQHVMLYERDRVSLFCRDAAPQLKTRFHEAKAAVLFSATLRPWEQVLAETGGGPEDKTLSLRSPYPPENFKVTLSTELRTTYDARTPDFYNRLAGQIQDFLAGVHGNSLIFLPSYAVMREVQQRLPPVDLLLGQVLVQSPGMQEADVDGFLQPFRSLGGRFTGLAVLGGALNEGIDLPGDALRNVVVVGVGLPQVSLQNECLKEYAQNQDRDGFASAYSLPGWTRVLQAVGRVIRSEEDTGHALLIDHRYALPFYPPLFPDHWE